MKHLIAYWIFSIIKCKYRSLAETKALPNNALQYTLINFIYAVHFARPTKKLHLKRTGAFT